MSTYVYGIARAGRSVLTEQTGGVGEPPCPVRAVEESGLLALVSDCPERLRPKRRDLMAHQQVLAQAAAAGPVLPMRFGSLADDDDAVRAVLAEHAEHYQERLSSLDGKVEYNVKAVHDEEAVLRRVLSEEPQIRQLSDANREAGGGTYQDRLRLGEMVANAVKDREIRDAELVHQVLAPLAADSTAGPESSGWLANHSFLVGQEQADAFLTGIQELQRDHPQLELKVAGPLPPYSFVEPRPAEPAAAGSGQAASE